MIENVREAVWLPIRLGHRLWGIGHRKDIKQEFAYSLSPITYCPFNIKALD
jgi:hypothetical protein